MDVRPNWDEQPTSESVTGMVWRCSATPETADAPRAVQNGQQRVDITDPVAGMWSVCHMSVATRRISGAGPGALFSITTSEHCTIGQ